MKLAEATTHHTLWRSSALIPFSVEILEMSGQGCHHHVIVSSSESHSSGEILQLVDKQHSLAISAPFTRYPSTQAVSAAEFYCKFGTRKRIIYHSTTTTAQQPTVLKPLPPSACPGILRDHPAIPIALLSLLLHFPLLHKP